MLLIATTFLAAWAVGAAAVGGRCCRGAGPRRRQRRGQLRDVPPLGTRPADERAPRHQHRRDHRVALPGPETRRAPALPVVRPAALDVLRPRLDRVDGRRQPSAVPARASPSSLSGLALAGSTMLNPFVGGIFSVAWGCSIAIDAVRRPLPVLTHRCVHVLAAVPVALALAWCFAAHMVDGAGDTLAFGFWGPPALPHRARCCCCRSARSCCRRVVGIIGGRSPCR